ncbi:MAG: UDP-N-acetylmuramate dehydrogenase [Candidatus Chromulinivorax sp.]
MQILINIPLADKNYFGTGGSARYFAEPRTNQEFQETLKFAQDNNLEIFVLGTGANILIADEGFDGLVIRPQLTQIQIICKENNQAIVQAGAGVTIDQLINFCFDHEITGLEEFAGIPSSVGGAVYINLHYYEFLLEQFLVSATLIDKKNGHIITVDKNWFNFGYDQSKLQDKDYFVLDATFQLKKTTNPYEIAFARGRYQEIIRHRHKRFPYQYTCGSFFRNFHPHEVEHTDKKLIYVAYYLDKVGVKGELSAGKAIVSHQHANMIVAHPGSTSNDIINLTLAMQKFVFDHFAIKPQPECQLIGFKQNPFE